MSALNESMYIQYLAWYQGHRTKYGPKTAVLMQVGKFYEIYDKLHLETNSTNTNIREIAELCSLNLSEAKDPSNSSLLKLFGGFPEQSLPKFERQLLDNGYTVVVIVQKKDANGVVEERIVDYISSPGIFTNAYSSTKEKTDKCLVGMLLEPNGDKDYYVGITAVDINTGNTWSTETPLQFFQKTPNIDAIEPFLLLHPPAEIVCWWGGDALTTPTETQIRTWFNLSDSVIHIRNEKPGRPNDQFIRECFTMNSNLQPHIYLNLEKFPQAYRCVGALLKFIEEHIPSLLKALRNNTVWIPESRVRLGNAALQQLNIVSNSTESLLQWLQTTHTVLGRRLLRERILTPISDVSELAKRFEKIDCLKSYIDDNTIEKNLRSVYDISRLHRKLHLSTISLTDILHLLNSYKSIQTLIDKFRGTILEIQNCVAISTWINSHLSAWSIERLHTTDEGFLKRTHPWPPGKFINLDDEENLWNALIDEIHLYGKTISEPITIVAGEHTPFEFMITKKRFEKLKNKSIQFVPSSSKSTSGFLESDEIYKFQKRGTAIQRKWNSIYNDILSTILSEWSSSCNEQINSGPISEILTLWIAGIDVDFSLARNALLHNLCTPCFVNSSNSFVEIAGLRHPLIEQTNQLSPYIKHDVSLGIKSDKFGGAENGLLIYGTNASGKSSLMKALGISVLCAQSGIPVPAKFITISPYTGIFTRILGNDNLWASLSSFAVEMTEFRAILKYSNRNSLILGDELCSGTETRSATAIVSAGIQVLVKRGAQFLFATHLHEISEMDEIKQLEQVKFAHLGVEYRDKQIVYNRNLQPGPGKSLYGLEVCYGLDMDEEFLAIANKTREKRTSRYNSNIEIRNCEICGSEKNLETHHIIEQAMSVNGFVDNDVHKNRGSNLAILCDFCHKEHHSKRLIIHGWKDTSQGRKLEFTKGPEKPVHDENLIIERAKILLRQKKREQNIVNIIESEFKCTFTVSDLRRIKGEHF